MKICFIKLAPDVSNVSLDNLEKKQCKRGDLNLANVSVRHLHECELQ